MARPQKEGLDYFPLDVDIDQDDKVAIIEARHGMLGFGLIIKLLMKIYDNGYFYEWTEREQILFSRRVNVDINEVNVIINDSLKWGLFSKTLFDNYNILTSRGVQTRYLEAVKRRKDVTLISEYLLIADNELKKHKNIVIVSINKVNANINSKNACINPQSKVEESKEYIYSSSCSKAGNIFQFYQENIGFISPFQTESLNSYIEDGLEPELLIEAMKDSLGTDNKWKYLTTILNRCIEQKIYTLEQYNAAKVEHENKKNGMARSKQQGQMKTWTEIKEEEFQRAKRIAFENLKKEGYFDDEG